MDLVNRIKKLNWKMIEAITIVIFFLTPKLTKSNVILNIIYSVEDILGLFFITGLLIITFFNKKEEFNKDSLGLCSALFFPLSQLFFVLIIGKGKKGVDKLLKENVVFTVILILLFLLYFWLIYLFRCKIVIDEIQKNWYIFLVKMIKPMLSAVLVCLSATIIINSLLGQDGIKKLIYQVINIIINSIYPFIDMYTYVRSEIDEFDTQDKEKYKYDFYNYD